MAVIFILLLINAFFSLSEMAIVSASKPILRQKAKQGDRRALTALRLAEDPGNFLSTVQVGITLVGTLAGAYGGAAISDKIAPTFAAMPGIGPYADSISVALVVTGITYFSVIVGELIPKQLALSNAEALALIVARPMSLLSRVAAPIVFLFEISAKLVMRLTGMLGKSADEVTEAEVHAVLAEGAESGVIEKEEHDILRRIIGLGDRSVKSIMTHRTEVVSLDVNDTLEEIRREIEETRHSRYLVVEGDDRNVIGAVHARDILSSAIDPKTFSLRNLVQGVVAIPETSSCLKALETFKSTPMHIAIIVDEYGSTEGILTPSDLLEAIVGILPSNYDDNDSTLIRQRDDGSYLIDGRTPIHEVELALDLDAIETEGHFETIAGYLVQELRKSPEEGDTLERFGYRFEVIDMDGRRIDKILLTRVDAAGGI
ncbi:putative hemolysin [Gellertiella hungarica]|uniref:Putative hemolysin n=1 Tax=Gellertiella hungarica TaxID=1572859 RepID=A0A7W6NKF0_9HYPH|nr:putative hemolysin [Gellertiella hungarica]